MITTGTLIASAALAGCGGATTPAARWDNTERTRMSAEYPSCEFFEDKAGRTAGYSCDLGTFRAHDLSVPEDHAALAKRLAEAKAGETFTAPLGQITPREPLSFGDTTLAATIATYVPEQGTIIPPEVFLIASPEKAGRLAFSCAVTFIAALDTPEAMTARVGACVDGLRLLFDASR